MGSKGRCQGSSPLRGEPVRYRCLDISIPFSTVLLSTSAQSNFATKPKRLQRAKDEGDLSPDLDPGDFARYLSSVICGMAVQAVNGATRQELQRLGDFALKTLGYA